MNKEITIISGDSEVVYVREDSIGDNPKYYQGLEAELERVLNRAEVNYLLINSNAKIVDITDSNDCREYVIRAKYIKKEWMMPIEEATLMMVITIIAEISNELGMKKVKMQLKDLIEL